ncbi:alanine racemase [Sphingomonas colocasiae]|uniref:alanine racemase n=1 Tax=Sphingomonas colocasiae TaxID=1848973 RepID=A0ABS7PWI8_9SPHN|nr:alanine racemase [Sphingomonas colocasiae]MBY8825511.1 alanine racemase [Sphingomonas colocasiae]
MAHVSRLLWEDIVQALLQSRKDEYADGRGNVIAIDVRAFAGNVDCTRTLMAPGAALYQVVKADGYGFGIERAIRLGLDAGVDGFCVGTIQEALRAKALAPAHPILLFTACPPALLAGVACQGVIVTVNSVAAYQALDGLEGARFMMEFDCGFGRFGLDHAAFDALLAREGQRTRPRCLGGYTHFGSRAGAAFDEGLRRFDGFGAMLRAAFGDDQLLMAAASHGLVWRPGLPYPGAHPGSLLYGMVPAAVAPGFAPVLRSVTSPIIQVNRIAEAQSLSVGYGSGVMLPAGGATGVFPLGWNDGLSTGAALGSVLVRGRRAPVIARTLFHSIVDLSGIDTPAIGEAVTVIGTQGGERIGLHDAADAMEIAATELHFRLAGAITRGVFGGDHES